MKEKKFKIGEKIFLIKSNNGAKHHEGKIVEVTAVNTNHYYCVKTLDSPHASFNIYLKGPADEFCEPERETIAKHLEEKNKEYEELIKHNEEEITRLRKYASEEEYLASKLKELIDASKNNDVATMAEVLKFMKKQDYL